jgi:catechol 2,3-dioxygenase-like lactoylglutathione lyase family enzyme
MEKSLSLYQELLGLDKVQDVIFEGEEVGKLLELKDPKFRIVHLKVRDDILELMEFIQPAGENKAHLMANDLGITHFCFRVENAAELILKIQAAGYSFSSDTPVTTPTGRKVGYFRDPDGILVEILQEPIFSNCGNEF